MQVSTDRVGLKCARCLAVALACYVSLDLSSTSFAQQSAFAQDGPQVMVDGARAPRRGGPRGEGQPVPATATPQPTPGATPGQPAPGGEKKPGEPGGEKKDEKPTDVQRPEAPPKEADPKELEIILNEHSQVPPFNFQGQPWPAVLQWYTKLANCSFDWQELPTGYVNVFTQRPYGLDDVRSLLNRYLLARGFVLIQRDRVVSVFKMDNLDPSLVEQVSEIELYNRKPYDVVKVVIQLPKSVDVAKLKDEVKQVLNPKAKLMALVTTKQILAIDAVSNLQTLSQMLNEERAKEDGKSPLKEFVLKYRRAEEVIDILYVTLGLDPKSKPSQMELQLQQQKMQIMQQMQQRGADVASMLKKDGPPVFLSYNRQKNSVIANAPEEQMDLIEKTLKMLDVPIGGATSPEVSADVAKDRSFKTATFKLKTLNPQSFQTTLEEIGGLDPFTVLKADMAGKALFVQGIVADHERIKDLIEQLDGEERLFKMIQLRRYPASDAAITIRELIAGRKEVKEESSQDSYYRALANMYSSSSSRNGMPKDDPHEGFYVAADEVNNRLLIKANKLEMEMITSLLRELGEVPTEQRDGVAMRVMDPPGADILDQIRKAWAQTEHNPLVIDGTQKATPKADEKDATDDEKKKPQTTTPAKDRGVKNESMADTAAVFAHFAAPENDGDEAKGDAAPKEKAATEAAKSGENVPAKSEEPTAKAMDSSANPPAAAATQQNGQPPVSVTITEDGRIVIRSTDPEAVERMEDLISKLSPAPKRVKVFPIKHQYAGDVSYNLKAIFAEETKEDAQTIRDWYGNSQKTSGRESGTGLGKRAKMMIDYDIRTNSVFVSNGSAAQLKEIGDLIADFDQPPPEDKVRGRRTAAIKVKYSKASIIAAALKEAYIDWLTTRDKEFDSGDGKQRNSASASRYLTDIHFGEKAGEASGKPIRTGLAFNGELSIGVEDISNNIIVSCQEDLFDGVVDIIHKLDEESAPNMSIVVQPLSSPAFKGSDLQKTMSEAVGKPWLGNRPEDQQGARGAGGGGQPPPQGENAAQGNNRGGGPRGARGGR